MSEYHNVVVDVEEEEVEHTGECSEFVGDDLGQNPWELGENIGMVECRQGELVGTAVAVVGLLTERWLEEHMRRVL